MIANITNTAAGPFAVYAVTAVCCWLMPARLATGENSFVINIFPTQAFALASCAIAFAHGALALRGRMVLAAATSWALATISTVTMFVVLLVVPPSAWSAFRFAQALIVALGACALGALAWQVARRRVTTSHAAVRAIVALGLVLLALCYAALALRGLGVLSPPEGFEQMAELSARLTIDLRIGGAVVAVGAAGHVVLSRVTRAKPPN
jgi:hypothetical protein